MASITRRLYVGRLFHPDHELWPEGAVFVAGEADYNLALFLDDPAPSHVRAVTAGPLELALHVASGSARLLYRFEDAIAWSDAPIGAGVSAPDRSLDPESRALPLRIALVDAATGVVRSLRTVRLPPYFAQALREARIAIADPADSVGTDAPVDESGDAYDSLARLAEAARVTLRVDGAA